MTVVKHVSLPRSIKHKPSTFKLRTAQLAAEYIFVELNVFYSAWNTSERVYLVHDDGDSKILSSALTRLMQNSDHEPLYRVFGIKKVSDVKLKVGLYINVRCLYIDLAKIIKIH